MKKLNIIGAPFYFGQPHLGVALAPDDLRQQGLLKKLCDFAEVVDHGNIAMTKQDDDIGPIKNSLSSSLGCLAISQYVSEIELENDFLLTIGGDHGMSLGSIHGILNHRPETVVVWADAHGDINTPEISPSGNFHGMPLAFLLKLATHPHFDWLKNFLIPEKLILMGPRDLDEGEKEIINRLNIQYFSSSDLNRQGSKEILEMALHRADPTSQCPIHLSFDVDLFDQFDIHSTGTRVPDGPKLEEVFFIGGWLAQTGRLRSMDLVEFNPALGSMEQVTKSRNLVLDFLCTTLNETFSDQTKSHLPSQVLMRAFSRELIEEYIS